MEDMLISYYSKEFDSRDIFDKLKVSKGISDDKDSRENEISKYNENIGKYHVVRFDFSIGLNNCKTIYEYFDKINRKIIRDIKKIYKDIDIEFEDDISDNFDLLYDEIDEKYVFIIDEWDYIFNNNLFTSSERKDYLKFLRNLLKGKGYVAFAYMTGVLPIAKYSSGSDINMFNEYIMFENDEYSEYFGFTEDEVRQVCSGYTSFSFDDLASWYNGYKTSDGTRVFNPRSVVCALQSGRLKSYWTQTSPMEEVVNYIKNDVEDIREDVLKMVAGDSIQVRLEPYSAENMEVTTREEIFAAMVTYGFLSYYNGCISIPNKELMLKFESSL